MANGFNPEMLTLAREARGVTQSELATRLRWSQARVSKYESGILEVSDDDCREIAHLLDFPPPFFYQTDKIYGFGSPCFYHRKRTRMPVAELKKIQARLNIFRFHITRLLRNVEIEIENRFIRLDIDEQGSPEQVARALRQEWGLPIGPVSNVINAVEQAGAIAYAMPFGTQHLDAVSQVAAGCPPLIFVNSDIPADRLRFTLMHEIGHIVMHRIPSEEMEDEADKFAAEFLMPAAEIGASLRNVQLTQLPALKTIWKTSMAALIKRAFDLRKITDRQYRRLFTELSAAGWRTREPVEIPEEAPTVFKSILHVHLTSHAFTVAELCRMVNATESRFAAYLRSDLPANLRIVG